MLKDIDKFIINELYSVENKSYREIADNAGVSASTIFNRVDKMKKDGLFIKTAPVLNFNKELPLTCIIKIKLTSVGFNKEFKGSVLDNPHVYNAYLLNGEYNICLLCKFYQMSELKEYIIELNKSSIVKYTESEIVLDVLKEDDSSFVNIL